MWTFSHTVVTEKTANQIWQRYASPETWNTWDSETEWAKLNGPFQSGSTITFKPKGGPIILTTMVICEPNKRILDRTKLFLAQLDFDHILTQTEQGLSVAHIVTISGPLTFFWKRIFGYKIAAELPTSMRNLIDAA